MDKSTSFLSDRIPWPWILIAAAVIFYIPFIGGVHLFDWDEINFAEISREMISTGDYLRVQIDYQPFFEKPPFFFWLQALSMHLFGINEFAARLPNAIGGIIVLIFLYKTGTKWIDRRFGLFWALSYLGSILPTLYHKSGIIDPWFNLFIFGSIAAWIEGSKINGRTKWYWICGILSGLAILTKGPVGPLIIGLTILIMRFVSKDRNYLKLKSILPFLIGNIIVAGLWFGIEWMTHGPEFLMAFLKYQLELLSESVAGHKGFPGYHFVVALFGIFPASIIAIPALRIRSEAEDDQKWKLRLLMMILLALILVLFSIVQSKIVHYSSLAYYPVSFLSAWTICHVLDGRLKWTQLHSAILLGIASIICLSLFTLPYLGLHLDWFISILTLDDFTKANLNTPVIWNYFDFIPFLWFISVLFISYLFFRKLKFEHSIFSLFIGIAILVNIALLFFIGKIEHYSQRAAIEFCESKSGQQVEITTIGYRSYVPFFYARKPVPVITDMVRPHYYMIRADRRQQLNERPELKVLYEKNGFIFLEE